MLTNRSIKAIFILVQADGARTRTDAEIKRILEKFLGIWAGTVDGELDRLDVTVDGSGTAPSSAIKPP